MNLHSEKQTRDPANRLPGHRVLAAQQRITEETKGCSLLEHTRTTTACLGHSALLLFLLLKIAGLLASTVDSARSRFGYRSILI